MAVKIFQYVCVASLALGFLAGCKDDTAKTADSVAHADQVAQENKSHSKHDSFDSLPKGKPGAQVNLSNNQVFQLDSGATKEFVFELAAPYDDGEMIVNLTSTDGLIVVSGESSYEFALDQTDAYRIPVTLQGLQDGRHYVNLHVTVNHAGRETFRSLAAIIQVGQEANSSLELRQKQQPPETDGVISLPAREEILQ